jgi:SepF-like predicted cell division protein (DUF552 family)
MSESNHGTDDYAKQESPSEAEEEFWAKRNAYDQSMDSKRREEIEAFLAEAKAEALRIDPETADVTFWWADWDDPYRIYNRPEEFWCCINREYFARNPGSDIWVWWSDLPEETQEKLTSFSARRKRMQRATLKKQFSAETLKQLEEAKNKLRSGPPELVIEDLRSLAKNDEMPNELAGDLQMLAEMLDCGLGSLNEVEQDFLDIFFPEDDAGVEFGETDARRSESLVSGLLA